MWPSLSRRSIFLYLTHGGVEGELTAELRITSLSVLVVLSSRKKKTSYGHLSYSYLTHLSNFYKLLS